MCVLSRIFSCPISLLMNRESFKTWNTTSSNTHEVNKSIIKASQWIGHGTELTHT